MSTEAEQRMGDAVLLDRLECAWAEQCGACLNVVNEQVPKVLAENARLNAENENMARRLLTSKPDREYAEMKQERAALAEQGEAG